MIKIRRDCMLDVTMRGMRGMRMAHTTTARVMIVLQLCTRAYVNEY